MDERGKRKKDRQPKACFYCNESGHIKANCPKKKQDERNRSLKCFKCGEIGHFQRNCTQLHSRSTHDGSTCGVSNGKPRKETPPVEYSVTSDTKKITCVSGASAKAIRSDDEAKAEHTQFPPFIDTHCHLEYVFTRYHHQSTFQAFMEANKYQENFDGCISTFCDPAAFSSFGVWQDLLMEPNIWGAFGIHPHNAKYYYSSGPDLEDKILKCIEHPKCVAYGEIGLDFADHSPSDQQTQREVLVRQLQLAISFSKPLLFHCRDADDELLHIISEYVPREWKIHLHCYTGSESTAISFLENFPNLYFGVCGNVTYRKNNDLRQMVTNLPTQRLVIETDAPYNTPANISRNCRFSHPAHAFYVAKEIAALKKADLSEVLITIRENTKKLYSI
ncbi:putative deoxyribonuclease TATDN2 [Halichondria panicea]|uniref:putative deoxyribonuclease TATDN2 n=1 Tax=Halichondria panicea TaxID=6063 RepID=UPI00312B3BD5